MHTDFLIKASNVFKKEITWGWRTLTLLHILCKFPQVLS